VVQARGIIGRMSTHYLDWAASAPPYPEIIKTSAKLASETYGNPSSRHAVGREASRVLEEARTSLAASIGTTPEHTIFTSGGTESDAMALLSAYGFKPGVSMVISAIEHPAVDEQARFLEGAGVKVFRIRPDADGLVNAEAIANAIRKDTVLVSVMAVNNETGAIQSIRGIADAIHRAAESLGRKPFFHCDAVQALGKVPFDVETAGIDGAAFSAHKLGGPRGIGALYLRKSLEPIVRGGGQERGIRPGTQNTAGAWALARAAELSLASLEAGYVKAAAFEKLLFDGVRSIHGAVVVPLSRVPGDARYSPYIACIAFPGLGGETMARILDDEGIQVSTGSACSGGTKGRRVLDAMGLDPDLSFASIRVSTGRDTTAEDVYAFLEHARSRIP
jgi:cysteine desulfurase